MKAFPILIMICMKKINKSHWQTCFIMQIINKCADMQQRKISEHQLCSADSLFMIWKRRKLSSKDHFIIQIVIILVIAHKDEFLYVLF